MKLKVFLAVFVMVAPFKDIAFAHHGDNEKVYNCSLVSESKIIADYRGGDSTSEGGGFFGSYKSSKEHAFNSDNKTSGLLILHGNENVGGYLAFDAGADRTIDMSAPIIRRKDMERTPFTRLKDGSPDETIWWIYGLQSGYDRSVFMTFSRGVLRTSIYGNSPTSAVGRAYHHMYDCKFVKPSN